MNKQKKQLNDVQCMGRAGFLLAHGESIPIQRAFPLAESKSEQEQKINKARAGGSRKETLACKPFNLVKHLVEFIYRLTTVSPSTILF